MIKAEFLVRDVPVLVPENDNEPYDLVVEVSGTFYRVQCKTGYGDAEGRVSFETRSTWVKSTGYERDTYRGKADLLAVYNPLLDVVSLVTVDAAPTTTTKIRWSETTNNQATRVNWHADYLIDTKPEGL